MSEILSILSSVGFNWHVALANFVNFLIILFIVNKFFFGKIGKTIEKRQEIIERGLNQASDAEKLLADAAEKKSEIIKTAEREGKSIVNDAHAKGAALVTSLETDAQEKIDTKLQSLAEMEASVEKRVEDSFAKKAPELVAELYKKSLLTEMNEEENNAFINRIRI
jgi:F-type H+-transporting ATPase subunit b